MKHHPRQALSKSLPNPNRQNLRKFIERERVRNIGSQSDGHGCLHEEEKYYFFKNRNVGQNSIIFTMYIYIGTIVTNFVIQKIFSSVKRLVIEIMLFSIFIQSSNHHFLRSMILILKFPSNRSENSYPRRSYIQHPSMVKQWRFNFLHVLLT